MAKNERLRRQGVWLLLADPPLTLLLFALCQSLAPQIYYLYYLQILENLPWQWVIGLAPPVTDLWDLLIFRERNNLSHHSRAALGWLMLVIALIRPRLT